jgi:hypothetical protein
MSKDYRLNWINTNKFEDDVEEESNLYYKSYNFLPNKDAVWWQIADEVCRISPWWSRTISNSLNQCHRIFAMISFTYFACNPKSDGSSVGSGSPRETFPQLFSCVASKMRSYVFSSSFQRVGREKRENVSSHMETRWKFCEDFSLYLQLLECNSWLWWKY